MSEMDITLAEQTATLRCTVKALRDLDKQHGGFPEIVNGLTGYRFSTFCAVVAAGLGKRSEEVEEQVFKTGMPDLVGPLCEYVGMLMNGGRKPEPEDKKEAPAGNG